jgi:ABC-type Zn uptake system ZnuABC Zn-binding protein ZnuA
MGLFSSKDNTVSDKDMKKLQDRARKAEKESMFSKKQVAKRLASNAQQKKSIWS